MSYRFKHQFPASRCAAFLLFICTMFAASGAHAALGDLEKNTASLASMVLNGAAFERSYADADGTTIHEYANAGGQIFAYTWEGPSAPNLRTLLGSRFDVYRNASEQQPPARASLHAQHLAANDVIVESGGAMRAYLGRAWLPGRMPSGVTISELQ